MEFRKFGNTDLLVSEIGFGAWAIGGGAMIGTTSIGWGDSDDANSEKAIYASLDAGINFFDTADIYGLGHSEKLLGKTIGKNNEIIIATKVGNVARNKQFTTDYSKKYILNACEESLKRLNRETIDYYQLHTARLQQIREGDCVEAMQLLQQQGKVRYWGLSLNTFDPAPEANFLMEKKWGNGFQLVLNLLNQKAVEILSIAAEKGYGIIARMPLQFGLLTGKFDTGVDFPNNDHRKNRLTPEIIQACSNSLETIWDLCTKYNCTKTQLAFSYLLSYPEVSVIIPGIRTTAQVKDNTSGFVNFSSDDIELINKLGKNEFVTIMEMIQKQG